MFMPENKESEKKDYTFAYIIGSLAIVGLFIFNHYKKFTNNVYLGIGIGIIIVAYFIIKNRIDKDNIISKEIPEKERLPTDDSIVIINDYLYYNGEILDCDKCVQSKIIEDNAIEETEKIDTPVIYINTEDTIDRNRFDIVMKTDKKMFREILKFKRKMYGKNFEYYTKLMECINITTLKNLPYSGKEKQMYIRQVINGFASKSTGNYIMQWDKNTKKYLGTKRVLNTEQQDNSSDDEDEDEE